MPKKRKSVGGIDPSFTGTGIAAPDGTTMSVRFSAKPKQFDQQQWKRYRAKVITAAVYSRLWSCDLIVIEGFSYGSVQGREDLGYLGHLIRDALDDMRTPWLEVQPRSLKKFATGSGTASKDEMREAAIDELGLDPTATDDEADAIWLREIGLHAIGNPTTTLRELPKIELPPTLET